MPEPDLGGDYDYSSEIRLPVERFELWFQPVYHLKLGKVLHNEVLVRWRNDSNNLRAAKEFLPFLNNSGLMGQLDSLVINKALEVLLHNSDATLSINLSSESLSDPNLASRIKLSLKQTGILPQRLGFEIDEATIAHNFEMAVAFITEIRTVGCHAVLDSFTGKHLSLCQWQNIPVDAIKLDPEIIQNLSKDLSKRDLVREIVQITAIWGKHCIAKSVGDASTLKLLREMGIPYAQGNFLRSPDNEPNAFLSIAVFIGRILSTLIALYVIKSALGINIFLDQHLWEVISSFLDSLFK